jgi:hypothetical protein
MKRNTDQNAWPVFSFWSVNGRAQMNEWHVGLVGRTWIGKVTRLPKRFEGRFVMKVMRRCLVLVFLSLFALYLDRSEAAAVDEKKAQGQGDNPAEQLFRQMESNLSKATTVTLSFDVNFEEIETGKLKGTLTSMSGNKARFEMRGKLAGERGLLMVSDGTRIGGSDRDERQDTPKKFDELIRAFVSRSGVALASFVVSFEEKPKDLDAWGVSEFRLREKEKVDEQEVQTVEYQLTPKGATGAGKGPFTVVVWLSAETNLPVKRVITGKLGERKLTITEAYSKMVLDGKLDEKQFELPK